MGVNLQVIGAGLGRTGTTSLKIALETLLKGACFHFIEYKSCPELMDPWSAIAQKMPLSADPDSFSDVPLSEWAGRQIVLEFSTGTNKPSGESLLQAGWAQPRIEAPRRLEERDERR